MAINIRKNIFETNSSSTHSLVICPREEDYKYNSLKKMTIKGDYYGRPAPKILSETEDKLNYIWTAICDLFLSISWTKDYKVCEIKYTDDFRYWLNELQRMFPNTNFIVPNKNNVFDIQIDHVNELQNFFTKCRNNINILEDLLFEIDSFIIVESDEHCMTIRCFCPDYWKSEEQFSQLKNGYQVYVKGN